MAQRWRTQIPDTGLWVEDFGVQVAHAALKRFPCCVNLLPHFCEAALLKFETARAQTDHLISCSTHDDVVLGFLLYRRARTPHAALCHLGHRQPASCARRRRGRDLPCMHSAEKSRRSTVTIAVRILCADGHHETTARALVFSAAQRHRANRVEASVHHRREIAEIAPRSQQAVSCVRRYALGR